MVTLEAIAVAEIHLGPETQTRAATNTAVVERYAEAMRSGAKFPPLVVFIDGANAESLTYLADGFHRLLAYKSIGATHVECNVHGGGRREAIAYALSANNDHGLPLTLADKKRKLQIIMDDYEWKRLSTRGIAELCGLSHTTISRLLEEEGDLPETIKTRDGKTQARKRNGKKSGKKGGKKKDAPQVAAPVVEEPPAEEPANEPVSDTVLDELDNEVPADLVPVFTQRAIFKQLGKDIDSIRQDIAALATKEAGHYLAVHLPGIDRELKAARDAMLATAPYALHKAKDGSRHPDWVSKGAYKALGLSESEEPVPF